LIEKVFAKAESDVKMPSYPFEVSKEEKGAILEVYWTH
jgi:hypothetical protein